MNWIINTPWVSMPLGGFCVIGLFVVIKGAVQIYKTKFQSGFKADIKIDTRRPLTSNDLIAKLIDKLDNQEQKRETRDALMMEGVFACLDGVIQLGANKDTHYVRAKLRAYLAKEACQ